VWWVCNMTEPMTERVELPGGYYLEIHKDKHLTYILHEYEGGLREVGKMFYGMDNPVPHDFAAAMTPASAPQSPGAGGEVDGLNPQTSALVDRFAAAMKAKLRNAELKYGYQDGWLENNWQDDWQRQVAEHLAKGDPLDVANFMAFGWHHGWATPAPSSHALREALEDVEAFVKDRIYAQEFQKQGGEWVVTRIQQALAQAPVEPTGEA
jgi:hypothetical protein